MTAHNPWWSGGGGAVALTICLMGPFRVEVDGAAVPDERWPRRDAADLVKLLALRRDRRLPREQVLDLLWPAVSEAGPRLHSAAHYARRALGRADAVVLRNDVVALAPGEQVIVDVDDYERAAEAALADGSALVAGAVLDRYPADPLPSEIYTEWARERCERLLALRYRLLGRARRWQQMIELDPVDEHPRLELIRELVAAGDRAAARREYDSLERMVRRELGTGPGLEALRLRAELATDRRPERPGATPIPRAGRQRIRFLSASDGVRIACAEAGEGPPLVKAANYLTHVEYDWQSPVWRHWCDALAARHRYVRYDERGCGLSDWEVEDFSLEAWVSDLETVVDGLRLERFPLLGISQGGAVAIAYAVRHPERVTHLILYGAYALGRFHRPSSAAQQQEARTLLDLMRIGWGQDNPAFRQTFTTLFMPEATLAQQRWFNELQRRTTSPRNALRFEEAFYGIDVTALAPRVRAPTLILHARGDAMIPFDEGRRLAALIPESTFVPLEGRNHILLENEPGWARFVEEVNTFVGAAASRPAW